MTTEQNQLNVNALKEHQRVYNLYKEGKATWEEYVEARDKALFKQFGLADTQKSLGN